MSTVGLFYSSAFPFWVEFSCPCSPFLFFPYLYSFLIASPQCLVYQSFDVHTLSCSHYYIFFRLSLHMPYPSEYLIVSLVFSTPNLALISDFLNPLYFHHSPQHSHLCSFWHNLLRVYLLPNRPMCLSSRYRHCVGLFIELQRDISN